MSVSTCVAKAEGGVGEGRNGSLGLADAKYYIQTGWITWAYYYVQTGWITWAYSTGSYIQCPGINHNGKEYKKECTYVYN